MRIVVNEDTLLFSPYTSHVLVLTLLYGALHTGRNLTDDLVTTATLQLHPTLFYTGCLEKMYARRSRAFRFAKDPLASGVVIPESKNSFKTDVHKFTM